MDKLGYEEGEEEQLQERRRKVAQDVHNLQEQVDTLHARYVGFWLFSFITTKQYPNCTCFFFSFFSLRFPHLQFEYRDPEKNFDRSKVFGPVATLIQVKDVKAATALEVSAGGKVRYFLVVNVIRARKKFDGATLMFTKCVNTNNLTVKSFEKRN